ncbi:pyridoxamine 5'-phosphate oxidase family protein [Sphingomicrobium sediminis]|uniref:Pyridoxamine 5'-phosphate oxidase family protein n=1 Tax=Sphingomicrobium sediminis TaxID=2950949 RepID=A0A9X2J430_9SPHN|nr:pyridoxamine 5'-phosphate oxidase family protein [Sphingomicrobium sediminis]MCM8556797.1 pyridoxamine 5'-phosphate oxidase family protein [Sphingomicrobium sediminis]
MEKPETLDEVLADIKARLALGAGDRKTMFHTPAIVTADVDARVMVLRDFDPDAMRCRFHTDLRSPKVAAVEADPRVAMLAYDKPSKLQLRARGRARIVRDGDLVDAAWAGSTNFAKRCYLGDAPSDVSRVPTSGLPEQFEGVEPDDEQLVPARENFGLLLIDLDEVDWFTLAHDGHRRAIWRREGEMEWLAP